MEYGSLEVSGVGEHVKELSSDRERERGGGGGGGGGGGWREREVKGI